MSWRNDKGLTLMPPANRSVAKFGGQRGVHGRLGLRRWNLTAHARAKAQLAPLPGAKFQIAHRDAVGVVEQFDVTLMAAHHKPGLWNCNLEVVLLRGKRLFRQLPESVLPRQEQRSK